MNAVNTMNAYDWDLDLKLPFLNVTNNGNPCYQDGQLGECSINSSSNNQQKKCNIYGLDREISCQGIEEALPSDISGELKGYLTNLRNQLEKNFEKKVNQIGEVDKDLTYLVNEFKHKNDFRQISSKLRENNLKMLNQKENTIGKQKDDLTKTLNQNELDFLNFYQQKYQIEKEGRYLPMMEKIVRGLLFIWILLLVPYYLLSEIRPN